MICVIHILEILLLKQNSVHKKFERTDDFQDNVDLKENDSFFLHVDVEFF